MVRRRKNEKSGTLKTKDVLYDNNQSIPRGSAGVGDEGPLIEHRTLALFTSGALLAIYVATLHPSVPGGDSGELINAAHELGVAHPPGYPVFTLAAKLFMKIVPLKTVAWRVNLLNALFSAAAGGFLQMAVLKLTSDAGASLFAVCLFCLSKLTWTYSVTAEVFGLNNLMVAILLYLSVKFEIFYKEAERDEAASTNSTLKKISYIGVFLCAFSLCNQHTIVLYVAVISLWVFYTWCRLKMLNIRFILLVAGCFLLGLLPYLYLPVSSSLNIARWTWGDQSMLTGLLTHILRAEYGTFDLGKDQEGLGFVSGILSYLEHIQLNLCFVGPALALIGCACSVTYFKDRLGEGCLFVFISMVTLYVSFFAWRANLDISNSLLRGVVERFFMQSDMVLVLLAAVGLHVVTRFVTRMVQGEHQQGLAHSYTCVAALVVLGLNLQNFSECNQSHNFVVHDFAKTMLNKMPENAIVLTKGDLPTNSLRYLYLCENMRPDVTLLDVEVLTYEWSLPMLGKFYQRVVFPGDKWHKTVALWPDGKRSFNMKMFLDANYDRGEIYACIGMTEKDLSWQEGYTLWPFGPCHRVVKRSEPLPVNEWVERTKDYSVEWKHGYDVFDEKSWEKVANDEMWSAQINTAFFMYAESQHTQDGKVKAEMLQAAHRIYLDAIKRHQVRHVHSSAKFPHYWHKNLALVCERLLYVEVKMSKANLCKMSIYHFEMYLASKPPDEDLSKIREAVENLRSRIDTYQKLDAIEENFGRKV